MNSFVSLRYFGKQGNQLLIFIYSDLVNFLMCKKCSLPNLLFFPNSRFPGLKNLYI